MSCKCRGGRPVPEQHGFGRCRLCLYSSLVVWGACSVIYFTLLFFRLPRAMRTVTGVPFVLASVWLAMHFVARALTLRRNRVRVPAKRPAAARGGRGSRDPGQSGRGHLARPAVRAVRSQASREQAGVRTPCGCRRLPRAVPRTARS